MIRPNDLGGVPGFGPIEIEPDEPPFHHEWERRVLAMYLATNYFGRWNMDQIRAARESMSRDKYIRSSYFEIWLHGIERLLDARGLVTREEAAADIERTLSDPRASRLDVDVPPCFEVGDSVRTAESTRPGHTRLPQYARGRRGVVTADHGVWIFADAAGRDLGFVPQHVYTVRFAATELWGDGANSRDSVYVDLWDDHLAAQ